MEYVQIALAAVGVASMVATITPNKKDDKYVQYALNFINLLGMNVGRAKNAGTERNNNS